MRDLLVFAIVLAALPLAIRRPFFGLLVFSWLAYMRPQDLCWGFARSMRLSFFVGIAMVAGWWAYEQGKRRFANWDLRTRLMVALAMFVSLSYAFAQHQNTYTNTYWFEYLKIILIALFTTAQVDSRQRLRVMLWVIALSLGFFGVKNGLFGILRGGAPILRGPGGMLEDNNDFALALVMNVPLLWYLGREEASRPWVRRLTRIAVVLTVVSVLLTHSRGGFLALVCTAMWIAWRSGHLVRAVVALGLCAGAFFLFAPEHVIERLSSIGDAEDSSRNARLIAWSTAMRMIGDNPLLGVGLRNFQPRFPEYSVIPLGAGSQTYVAHNSYLQIWAESGTIAFVVYVVLLGSVFLACARVRRQSRGRPGLQWAGSYARMMEATTVGFLVGAFFLNRGHFDLIYHWLALVSALVTITAAELREAPATAAAISAAPARRVEVRGGAWRPAVVTAPAVLAPTLPRWR